MPTFLQLKKILLWSKCTDLMGFKDNHKPLKPSGACVGSPQSKAPGSEGVLVTSQGCTGEGRTPAQRARTCKKPMLQ